MTGFWGLDYLQGRQGHSKIGCDNLQLSQYFWGVTSPAEPALQDGYFTGTTRISRIGPCEPLRHEKRALTGPGLVIGLCASECPRSPLTGC